MAPKIRTTDPAQMEALRRRGIKDPGTDPTIAMSRDRRQKELANEDQKLQVAGLVGTVLHKDLELRALMKDIALLEDGVQEYQDQIDLLNEKKGDIQKSMIKDEAWCAKFRQLIGPFEAKYEECKAEVKVSFDHAKTKYHESLQKLIDDFGFHPAFKRCVICLRPAFPMQGPLKRRSKLRSKLRSSMIIRCLCLAGGSMNSDCMLYSQA